MRKTPSHRAPLHVLTMGIASLLALGGPGRAGDLFWDINGSVAGTGNAVATGTWDATLSNWNPSGDGAGPTSAWVLGSRAVFGAGTDATGAYTVTVSGTQVTNGLSFEEGTVTLTGGTVNLAGTPTVSVASGLTATVGSVLSGTNGFEKTGAGTLVVTGANTLTGATTISGGTLKYGAVTGGGTYSFGLGSSVMVKNGGILDFASIHASTVQTMTWNVAPVTLEDGGIWKFRGTTGSNTHNVSANLTVNGSGTIESNGVSYEQIINLSGKLSGSGTINYLATSGSGSTTAFRTLTLTNATTDFTGNWFVDYTAATSDDFVTLKSGALGSLGTGMVTLDDRAQLGNGVAGGLNSLSGVILQKANSVLDVGAGWDNAAATLNVDNGTVKIGTSATSFGTINIGSLTQFGGTLAIDATTSGNDQITLAGNYDAFGGGLALSFASVPRTTSPYTLLTYGGALNGVPNVTISNPMRLIPTVEVGSGFNDKVTVSFSGTVGDLVWTGDMGPTFDLSNVNFSLNGSPEFFMTFDNVLFDDSALGSLNPTLNTTVMAGAVLLENQSNSYTFSGPGGFGGGTMLIKNGSGSVTLGTINTYTGPTIIGAGTMLMGAVNALPNGAGKSNVTVNGTLDLNSFNTTVNGLDGTGRVDNVAVSTATLTIGAGDTTSTFGGLLQNSGGTLNLTKAGTGALTLTGANTYSGLTTISAGTLRLVGPNTLTGGLTANGAGSVIRVDSLSQLPAGVLTLNNSAVLQANGFFTRAQGTGAGQVQDSAGMAGFSAVGGPLELNLGGAGAPIANVTTGFNSNGFLLNDAAATHSLTLVNPLNVTASTTYFLQTDATAPGVETILQGNVSVAAATTVLAKTGPGTLVLAGATNTLLGGVAIGSGTAGGTLRVGNGANITSATDKRLIVAYAANNATTVSSGTFTMDAGAGTVTFGGNSTGAANYLAVDGGTVAARTATATGNINGGTLNLTGMASGAGFFYIGANSGYATGVLNINGGTVNVGTKVGLGAVSSATAGAMGTGSSSNATVGVLSGSINLNSGALNIGTGSTADADRGTLYLTNDANTTGQATVALNGGSLSLSRFYVGNGAGTSSKTIAFNGTAIQARASRTDFLNAAPNAVYKVQVGGALIDTNGFDIAIAGPLVHDAALGATLDGGLVKSGFGKLTLSGVNTYTGPTLVSDGALALTGSVAGSVTISDGVILSGRGTIGGSLTVGNSIYESNGVLATAGALTVNGVLGVTLIPNSALTPGTPMPILTFGSTTAAPTDFYLANASSFRTGIFAVTGNQVTLDTGAKALLWAGSNGPVWDNLGTANWNDSASNADYFYTGDTVLFNDAATAANAVVSLSAPVTPAAVIVDNSSAVPYSFTAAGGSITGGTALLKKGNGTLTLSVANSFTGGTMISGGTIIVSTPGALGSGLITLGDASTGSTGVSLVATGSVDQANNVVVSASGTGLVQIGSSGAGAAGNATAYSGTITLNRPTTFAATATDRTAFDGKITGPVGLLTISGGSRATIGSTANDFVGDILITGDGTRLQTFVGSGAETIPNGSSVQIDTGAFLQLAGGANTTETINGFSGAGAVTRNVTGLTTLAVGSAGGGGTFSGVINNGSGTLGFTKLGAGTQVLSGANIYTGPTTVTGGTLLVDGSLSGSSAVTVNGGTLGGFGTVGAVTLTSGTLTSGDNSLQPLNTGSLVLGGGSALFELSSTGVSDQFNVAGSIAFTGNVQLNLGFTTDLPDHLTYTLINNDGADLMNRNVGGFAFGGVPILPGQYFAVTSGSFTEAFYFSYTGGDGNDFVLTVVPEPGVALALLSGLGVIFAGRRRRHRDV